MKKIFGLFLSLVLYTSVYSQPKNKVDSISLESNTLYQFSIGVKTARGVVNLSNTLSLNNNSSLFLLGSTGNGVESFAIGRNMLINGHSSFGAGNNHIIAANGSQAFGADHHIYQGADYSFVTGDANDNFSGGYAASLSGFGNDNHTEYGVIEGNDNIQGQVGVYSTASYTGGSRNKNFGSWNYVRGKFLFANGNNITLFGYGTSSFTPLTTTEEGFHIGYGTMKFEVLTTGKVRINGVSYMFPSSQGSAGSVLTNDGNGNLYWSIVAQPQAKGYMIYDQMGNLKYLIAKPY